MLKWREGLGLLAVTTGGLLIGAGSISLSGYLWILGLAFWGAGIFLVLFADLDAEDEK
jgi:hypothetical protein